MPVFRPSARVKLTLRFEEGANTAALEARLPAGRPRAGAPSLPGSAGLQDAQAELENVQATLAGLAEQRSSLPPEVYDVHVADLQAQREALQRRVSDAEMPAALQAGGDNGATLDVLPRSVQIDRNGLRTADTCSIVFDYRDAPIDPRVIRSAAVRVTIGVVPAGDFEDGMAGGLEEGDPASLVREGAEGTTQFVGFVDDWRIDLDGEDGDTISLDCRDVTALLHDEKLPSGLGIDLSVPLDEGVRRLLNEFPSTRGVPVLFGGEGERDQAPIPAEALPPARRARRGRVARRARSGDQSMSLWDHITDVCRQVGFVPYFDDHELRIIHPRTFYSGQSTARRMVYGRNLESLSFARKLGGVKVPTIEVRCYDPQLGRTRWARYPVAEGAPRSGVFGTTEPPRPTRANHVPPGGGEPEDKIETFNVDGVTDPARLALTAESIWHQLGRQEIEGSFKTHDVWSWEAPEEAADLLQLTAGDPVELLVASAETRELSEQITSATDLAALTREARSQYLERLGWDRDVAQRFSALQEAVSFQTIFRVASSKISYDSGEGIQVNVDFMNFLVVRELRQAQTAEAPSPEVEELTRGQQRELARQLRDVSAARRLLTTLREGGALDQDVYDRSVAELAALEQQRVREIREG